MISTAQIAMNDLLIEQAEIADRFPSFNAAAYAKSALTDGDRMARISKMTSPKARRFMQSGINPDIDAIERELSKLGYDVIAQREGGGRYTLLGVAVAFEEIIDQTSYRFRNTGKFSLFVGQKWSDGNRKRFPPKEIGTYSYAKVAEEIVSRYERKAAKVEAERIAKQKKASSGELVAQLREEFGLTGYNDTFKASIGAHPYGKRSEYVEYPPAEGKVWMSLGDMQVTPEQARAVMAVLREQGLTK